MSSAETSRCAQAGRAERRRAWWIALGLLAAAAALYAGLRQHEFVNFDDNEYIYDNAHVTAGLTSAGVRWSLTGVHSSNWHPLTSWSHMLDCELFALDAGRHHLVSVALHGMTAVLLFLALRALTGSFWPCAFVAALFVVHPLRVESVAWASERKDVLSGMFWMLTLLAYAHFARRPSPLRYALVTISLILGLLSKPMVVTLPFVLLLLDHWPLRRCGAGNGPIIRRRVLEKLPWFALAAASALVTFLVQASSGTVRALQDLSPTTRIAGALSGYALYLAKTLWPSGLAFYYPHPGVLDPTGFGLFHPAVIGSALFLALLSGLAWRCRRRAPYVTVGWCWFVLTLLPVIGLIQVGEQWWADRYAYVPLVGIYIAAAFAAQQLVARHDRMRAPLTAVALLALGGYAAVTWTQVPYWRTSRTLFERALAVTDDNYMAHNNLGLALLDEGHQDEGEAHFRAAIRIRPGDLKARVNLAIALAQRGALAEARRWLEEVTEERPHFAPGHSNLGSVLARMDELDAARAHYERAASLDPELDGPRFNIGMIHIRRGDLDAAAEAAAVLAERGRFATAVRLATLILERAIPAERTAARARLDAYRARRTYAAGGRP